MATTAAASDVREKILKEGPLRHKQTGIGLLRWRQRHVVFKITHSGRLRLIVYKELPAVPANEAKEIQIEQFGGLETNFKLDNEKYLFAIVTNCATDCFSAETPQEMSDWTTVLQEYLGKELVLNVNIPFKQHILKSGRAQLRVRNTGFTITTCDNPPRSQGSWQIIHIRKYGGSDSFRFQTGSKCPTGEYLYTLQTDDNARLKSLFNDLSQHKPIFSDDRVGRRMTLEKSLGSTTKNASHAKASNRFSLQSGAERDPARIYENRTAFQTTHHHSADVPALFHQGRRHSAAESDIANPLSHVLHSHAKASSSTNTSKSTEDISDGLYQNMQKSSQHGRRSPTKRTHFTAAASGEDIPDGYYTVAPPQIVKNSLSSNPSLPSSPEEESFVHKRASSAMSRHTPPICEEEEGAFGDEYIYSTREVAMKVVGENLVVQKGSSKPQRKKHSSPPVLQEGSVYQNLEFMKGSPKGIVASADMDEARRNSVDPSAHMQQPVGGEDFSPRNYTNVSFALKSVHGRAVAGKKASVESAVSPINGIRSKPRPATTAVRKISAPTKIREHRPTMSPQEKTRSATRYSPARLTPHSPSQLRPSRSNFELNTSGPDAQPQTTSNQSVYDYYNVHVPQLPANCNGAEKALGLRNQFTPPVNDVRHSLDSLDIDSNDGFVAATGNATYEGHGDEQPAVIEQPAADPDHYASFHRIENSTQPNSSAFNKMEYSMLSEFRLSPAPRLRNDGTTAVSSYDHLELRSSSNSPCFSPDPMIADRVASPRPNCYDTLAPESKSKMPYDTLIPRSEDNKSSSSSPEAHNVNKSFQYSRKVKYLRHSHRYESIEVDDEDSSGEAANTPTGSEDRYGGITSTKQEVFSVRTRTANGHVKRLSTKSTNTQPRKKHLPLQGTDCVTVTREQADTVAEKPLPESFVKEASPDSSHFLTRNMDDPRKDPVPTDESFHHDCPENTSISSPSHRTTHEVVSLPPPKKIQSIKVEIAEQSHPGSKDTRAPLLPPRTSNSVTNDVSTAAAISDDDDAPPLPPRPVEQAFMVPLPRAEFDFNKPPVPPKPRVLCPSESEAAPKYVAVDFINNRDSSHNDFTVVAPTTHEGERPHQIFAAMDSTSDRVPYVAVDFKMTAGLATTKVQVEDQRTKEMEFLEAKKN